MASVRVDKPSRIKHPRLELWWLRYLPVAAVLVGMYALKSAWLGMLLYHAGLVLGILLHRDSLVGLNWGGTFVLPLAFGVLGLVAGPLVYFALPLLTSDSVGQQMASQLVALGLDGKSLYFFAVYFVLVHPALEELGWRGVLFFRGRCLHFTDLEFAAYHLLVIYWLLPGNWLLLGVAFFVL